jgi:hypothetical protein
MARGMGVLRRTLFMKIYLADLAMSLKISMETT